MAQRTAQYLIGHKHEEHIRVYLQTILATNVQDVVHTLMQSGRWLSADEVTLMLNAYGKHTALITEHSYPLYDPAHAHVLLKPCYH